MSSSGVRRFLCFEVLFVKTLIRNIVPIKINVSASKLRFSGKFQLRPDTNLQALTRMWLIIPSHQYITVLFFDCNWGVSGANHKDAPSLLIWRFCLLSWLWPLWCYLMCALHSFWQTALQVDLKGIWNQFSVSFRLFFLPVSRIPCLLW